MDVKTKLRFTVSGSNTGRLMLVSIGIDVH